MLGLVWSLLMCKSRRRWLHRSDIGTEDLSSTTMPETFSGALSEAGWCGQTGFVGAGISLNRPKKVG